VTEKPSASWLAWPSLIALCALLLLLIPLSLANLVIAFAFMVRAFGLHTVWDDIFPWSMVDFCGIDLYTTAITFVLTYLAQALHGWIHRERIRDQRARASSRARMKERNSEER
jgi:hypothetical protein